MWHEPRLLLEHMPESLLLPIPMTVRRGPEEELYRSTTHALFVIAWIHGLDINDKFLLLTRDLIIINIKIIIRYYLISFFVEKRFTLCFLENQIYPDLKRFSQHVSSRESSLRKDINNCFSLFCFGACTLQDNSLAS